MSAISPASAESDDSFVSGSLKLGESVRDRCEDQTFESLEGINPPGAVCQGQGIKVFPSQLSRTCYMWNT
jgi:hypothetical protein